MFVNIAGYKFVGLSGLGVLRESLLGACRRLGLRGTILLSPEGINLFLAGGRPEVDEILGQLRRIAGLEDFEVKVSESERLPFNRMLVRIKREIIAFGVKGVDPARHPSPKLPAKTLKQWLDEGRPLTLLDTRNTYEVKLGTFKNAVPLDIQHFRDLPEAVRKLPSSMKEEPIVMFCTGGIRCEKAGPFMEREGFKNIFQLEGGILKYFEECGSSHYRGECFVFDQRVGVDPALRETEADQCFRCLQPLTWAEQRDPRYVPGRSCPHCFQSPEEKREALRERRRAALKAAVDPLPGSIPCDQYRPINVPGDCDGGTVLDALCRVVKHISRADWERDCERGMVVDEERAPVPSSKLVRAGERYFHKFPGVVEPPVSGDIEILHEDEALIVVNKPAPLPMHAAGRYRRNTLQSILNRVFHPEKPRQAHRLDANTTGVVLLTRTRQFAARLQGQFAAGKVAKYYLVLAQGHPAEDLFECDAPITTEAGEVGSRSVSEALNTGLRSLTRFRVLERRSDGTSLLAATPMTGRTNQIRVHLWHLNVPVVGDPVYLPGKQMGTRQTLDLADPPLCLHAWRIGFEHPMTRQAVEFSAPPPSWAGSNFGR